MLENFTYVFSTGERLDSMNIRGSAKDNYSYQEISGAMIGLYKNCDFRGLAKAVLYKSKNRRFGAVLYIGGDRYYSTFGLGWGKWRRWGEWRR